MQYIINADDYGLHQSCSKAIAEAFSHNLITDTTACANGEYIEQAIRIAENQGFMNRIGIHFNITTGKPLTEEIQNCETFCDAKGMFHKPKTRYFIIKKSEQQLLHKELMAQYNVLRAYGVEINHADSHHHIHTAPAYIATFQKTFADCGINKVRIMRNLDVNNPLKCLLIKRMNQVVYRGRYVTTDFFGGMNETIFLVKSSGAGVAEMMIHPDYDGDTGILIDRNKYQNGKPCGIALDELRLFLKNNRDRLISYSMLRQSMHI